MDNIRAQTTSKNGEISCSVEETNRIRAALGLKPLRVAKPSIPPSEPSKPEHPSAEHLRKRLEASRAARRRRTATIAPRSIAEQALYDDDDDDDDDDLTAWVERSRVHNVPKTPVVEDRERVSNGDAVRAELKAGIVAEDVDISGGETKTLTLRDADVIEAKDDVLEDHVAAAVAQRKKRDEEINGMVYDGTDNKQFENVAKKEGVESVAKISKVVEQDFKSEPVFKKVKKRSKKRRRRDPASVVQGSAEALRKAVDAEMAEESEDDEHYELLRKATAKAAERNMEGTVSRILKAVQKAEKGGDEEMEDGARLVGEEMAQFLGAHETDESETDEDIDDRKNEPKVEGKREVTQADIHINEKPDVDIKIEYKSEDSPRIEDEERANNVRPSTEAIPETGLETNGMTGIAATLVRLRTKGELKQKQRQRGRAKDKRFDYDSKGTGKKEIKLTYLDEFGNQLTAKEAFRELCRSFHGRGPGQNKREKRLRKMLEAAKNRSMQGDDTPLASAAALKEETRRLGSAHVVLSGAQALQMHGTEAGKAKK